MRAPHYVFTLSTLYKGHIRTFATKLKVILKFGTLKQHYKEGTVC